MERTITRRLNTVFDALGDELGAMYCDSDFELALLNLREADEGNRHDMLRRLYEMLDDCALPYEKRKPYGYYDKRVRDWIAEGRIPSAERMRESAMRIFRILHTEALRFPTPSDYMRRLVDTLSNPEDGWERDPLRLRILKQFIRYGGYLQAVPRYGKKKPILDYVKQKTGQAKPSEADVLSALDDGVFRLLETATKQEVKEKYRLLRVADDLAAGKFRTNGATKQALYLFAFAFGMTYATGGEDPERDIEKNLFTDFYVNNALRCLSGDFRENRTDYVGDPVGTGINYKNFAEMVYLYYLSRELSPEEKIRRSAAMIESLKVGRDEEQRSMMLNRMEGATQKMPELFTEDILRLPEEAFREWIRLHYDCSVYDAKTGAYLSAIEVSDTRNSAWEDLQGLLQGLSREGLAAGECTYGLSDLLEMEESVPHTGTEAPDAFRQLLLSVHRMLDLREAENETPASVTRTSLLAAFYYYYNERCLKTGCGSFKSLFRDFQREMNEFFAQDGYAPFSGKNLIDLLVAFSSYCYIKSV